MQICIIMGLDECIRQNNIFRPNPYILRLLSAYPYLLIAFKTWLYFSKRFVHFTLTKCKYLLVILRNLTWKTPHRIIHITEKNLVFSDRHRDVFCLHLRYYGVSDHIWRGKFYMYKRNTNKILYSIYIPNTHLTNTHLTLKL